MLARIQNSVAQLSDSALAQFAPARLRFIESLVTRAAQQGECAQQRLCQKASRALQALEQSFEEAREQARECFEDLAYQRPELADQAQALFDAGQFDQLRRLSIRSLQARPRSLGQLSALMPERLPAEQEDPHQSARLRARLQEQEAEVLAHHADSQLAQAQHDGAGHRMSTAMSAFRASLLDRQLALMVKDAAKNGPEHAGPINPEKLAIKSLELMQALSPDYLRHFVAHVDTLLWLERAAETK